jgi:ubiquinone/menaquinone biosynthesis C-methylase UbiE/DNA-binding transcriptional ArsR family regulator
MGSERRPLAVASRRPDALLGWMESLGDATRLRLLRLVERRELGVADLCHVLQMPQSTVSRHLKVLGDQSWVRSRAQGTTRLYTMDLSSSDPAARRLWLIARDQTEGWATVNQDQLRLTRHLAGRHPAAQAFFAGAAGQWDRLRSELYGNAFTQQALLGLLPPEWVVADLGCGTGQTTALLSPHVRTVVGVDQSAAMLKAAQRRTAGLANVDLRRGTLESLPVDDGTCDGALLVLALTYVLDPPLAIREMARILRPAGRAVIVDLLRHDREDFRRDMGQQHNGFATETLAHWLSEAGLSAATCRELPPEPQAKGPALILATAVRAPDTTRTQDKKEE